MEMERDRHFNFKVRDELKKMPEFYDLHHNISNAKLSTEAGSIVTCDMMIDIITYCSKGDLDLAISGLRNSQQFVHRCKLFLRSFSLSCRTVRAIRLLFEIWKHGFITTKCVLDWNWHLGEQLLPSHRILEQEIASMDAMEAINHPIGAKLLWILNSTDQFQERSSVINEVWKKRKQISEVQKSLTS